MRPDRDDLARALGELLSLGERVDLDDYSVIERRLLGCINALGNELSIRLRAGPLRRIAIEHDLHSLDEMPMLKQLTPAVRREVVRHMEDPRLDDASVDA